MSRLKRKRRRTRKDKVPFGHVRKPIPRPGVPMESIKDYKRNIKHKKPIEELD